MKNMMVVDMVKKKMDKKRITGQEIIKRLKGTVKIDIKAKPVDNPTIEDAKKGLLPRDGTKFLIQEFKKANIHSVLEEVLMLKDGKWEKDTVIRYSDDPNLDIGLSDSISYYELATNQTLPKTHLIFKKMI